MGSLSIWHWIIVLLVVMVLFGGRGKISSLMGDFAQGIKAFKKGMSEDEKTADTKSEPVKTIEAGGGATKTEAERRARVRDSYRCDGQAIVATARVISRLGVD